MAMSNRLFNTTSKIKIPKRIGVLGYGALGKCIVEVILHHHPCIYLYIYIMINNFLYIK